MKDIYHHVFEMYKVHHDATKLDVNGTIGTYELNGEQLPEVSVSASKDKQGKVHISLCNLNHKEESTLTIQLRGMMEESTQVSGRILTADKTNDHNTFEQPDLVKPVTFEGFSLSNNELAITLPPMSVVVLAVE